jgi:phosphoribosylformimino-5-aminoimidazole carboxamide ribotide isomerase
VVGSETGVTPETLSTLAVRFPHRLALSLDFRGEMFLGEPRLLSERTAWPDTVIAMTLARVGSGEGPDNARLGSIAAMAGLRRVYAAGGIRNRADIDAARMAGAAGALVATALHAGKIKTGDLVEIAG